MILTEKVVGLEEAIVHFEHMPRNVREALKQEVGSIGLDLAAYVKGSKLSGQVLNRKTGALASSINNVVEEQEQGVYGAVGSYKGGSRDNPEGYAAVHEYGGKSAYTILPVNGSVLSWLGADGRRHFAKKVTHPPAKERSFLRSSLADKRTEIEARIVKAVQKGTEKK